MQLWGISEHIAPHAAGMYFWGATEHIAPALEAVPPGSQPTRKRKKQKKRKNSKGKRKNPGAGQENS